LNKSVDSFDIKHRGHLIKRRNFLNNSGLDKIAWLSIPRLLRFPNIFNTFHSKLELCRAEINVN
jgi:hypothetical protein